MSRQRQKVGAVGLYRSQAERAYCSEEAVRAQVRARGVCIGTKYAEAFEVVRVTLR